MSVPVPTIPEYYFRVTPVAARYILEMIASGPYKDVAGLIADLTQQAQEQEQAWAKRDETAVDVSRETPPLANPGREPEPEPEPDAYDPTKPPAPVRETQPLIPPKGGPVVPPQRQNGPATSLRAR